ncbi:5'-nucleotidase [Maioricimonas sp. JC845]|uniref:5'-nucleotidase n=1 Tax=Maioricimonas sp. JC845 TaxID=3232138 RepID=UPI00345876FD
MPFPIEQKLVVAIASSALFDLRDADRIFREEGLDAYRQHQRAHQDKPLACGVAFPFIRQLLRINEVDEGEPVEVILLSRNDPDTGLRVFKSIEHYGLGITRGAFLNGRSPWRYVRAYEASLFLSANRNDVKEAIMNGHPAGPVLESTQTDDPDDRELRVAFDFDGVLADDEAERIYQETGDLAKYHSSEKEQASRPLNPGPLKELLEKIAHIQQTERKRAEADSSYEPMIRTAIITSRNAPAHERMITTLRHRGITVDETFFLGGMDKSRILDVFRPHIFFDDQKVHLDTASGIVPSVHVPFGVTNED